jgi:hypothetical protein
MRGLTAFCRIRSYIATAKAHGIGVFTALRNAFLGDPWSIHRSVITRLCQSCDYP